MFGPPFHPKLIHLPLGLAPLLPFLLVALAVLIARGRLRPGAWWAAVIAIALVAGGTFLAIRTGDSEEHRVEPVVGEHLIHEHEEMGEQLLIGSCVLLALALAGAFVRPRRGRGVLHGAATVSSVVILWLALRSGHSGGMLVYSHDAGRAYSTGANAPASAPGAREEGKRDEKR